MNTKENTQKNNQQGTTAKTTVISIENATVFSSDESLTNFDFKYIIEPPQGENLQSVVRLNELGFIAIPKAIRTEFGIEPKQILCVIKDDQALVIKKNGVGYDDCDRKERTLDELGRVVLPLVFRKELDIETLQKLSIYLSDDKDEIVVEKLRDIA